MGSVNRKQTSARLAEVAARALKTSSSKAVQAVAGAVLTQSRAPAEQTSARVAKAAAQILNDKRYGSSARMLAGSALSQTKRK